MTLGSFEEIAPPVLFLLGYSLFVACFFFREMLHLRVLAALGQIAFIPYYISVSDQLGWSLYVGITGTTVLVGVNLIQISILMIERRPIRLSALEQSLYDYVFSSLPIRSYRDLFRLGLITYPEDGSLLIERNSNIDSLYLILDGEAKVILDTGEVKTLAKGNFIGELSFITGQVTSADVRVKGTQTTLLMWDKDSLIGSLDNDPVLSHAFDLIISTDVVGKLQRMNAG